LEFRRNTRKLKEFQLKQSQKYKKVKEKLAEAKTSGISHRSWEVGRKTAPER
jgi:hypothetical protein